jgi:uncharacterized membrane protein HdeD (DUF308 family)
MMFSYAAPISRRHAAVRGVLALALGLVSLVWPGITIGVAVAVFAVYCFADAIAKTGAVFRKGVSTSQRLPLGVLAVIDVAAAIVAIVWPGITAGVLTIIVGVWAILGGGFELSAAWSGAPAAPWLTIGGIMSIIAGVLLIAWPGIGAVTLAIVFGAYLAAYGITLLIAAAKAPDEAHIVPPRGIPWPAP